MSCEPKCNCGCCSGTEALTPAPIYNRPGLDALAYRAGVHGSFFETMKARLSASEFSALANLGARTADDPSIAFLDAWATVADVLTFYQERLANEGYLRTATERRSVLELARLVGYEPRPGVASTVYLAYEIDKNAEAPVEIPAGSRVQSLPGPGELPQTFETVEQIVARREWNAITPRLERPHSIARVLYGVDTDPGARVYLKGIATGLKAGDPLIVVLLDSVPLPCRAAEVVADAAADRTLVRLVNWDGGEILAPSRIQVSRALLAWNATAPPGEVMAARILLAGSEFVAWLDEQVNASPQHPDVKTVMNHPEDIAHVLATLESVRKTATSGLSEPALRRAMVKPIQEVGGISGYLAEMAGVPNGGPIGAAADVLAEVLTNIVAAPAPSGPDRISVVLRQVLSRLNIARSVPPRNAQSLERDPATLFDANSDVGTQAVAALAPAVGTQLATAIRNAAVSAEVPIRVYALRSKGLLFGNAAPQKVTNVNKDTGVVTTEEWSDADIHAAESTVEIHLDAPNDKVRPGSWIVLDFSAVNRFALGGINLPGGGVMLARAHEVTAKLSRAAYGFSGQTTRIELWNRTNDAPLPWFQYTSPGGETPQTTPAFQLIRRTAVYAESEELPLAMEPMTDEVCGGDQWIETGGLYTGLETGRWLVISGERSDVPGTEGVRGSELVMLDAVQQYVQTAEPPADDDSGSEAFEQPLDSYRFEPGEKVHTFLKLASPLAYCYKRSTVAINANVVKATHGETRNETLGSGDASVSLQAFTLRQPPLTFVPANQPDGIDSTLSVYVNGVQWHEAPAMVALGRNGRGFVTRTGDEGRTTIVFGNGVRGARTPTGIENITAIYRNGIGKGGNVKAGQITNLLSRPLGVKGVNNPMEASGGADKETRDQARKNAPLAVMTLDRLVGTQDYADFARTFAGIAKAQSARLAFNGSAGVYVTVAGIEDIPIPKSSDLYRNLISALRTYGDPALPVQVEVRELLMLVLSARIAIHPDYRWEDVVDRVRAFLLDRYSFERQELAQWVVLSEAVAAIHSQRGVLYVDVEALGAVSQLSPGGELRSPQEIATELKKVIDTAAAAGRPDPVVPVLGIRPGSKAVLPAQLAFFVPSLPETLILNRIEEAR